MACVPNSEAPVSDPSDGTDSPPHGEPAGGKALMPRPARGHRRVREAFLGSIFSYSLPFLKTSKGCRTGATALAELLIGLSS